ncbi:MAG: hypothetical protein DRP83_01565 [Planctomycetota bacterium]|nr:MAG: hypothetical protein DRP83_01565 [Planctomycetota bacterium]
MSDKQETQLAKADNTALAETIKSPVLLDLAQQVKHPRFVEKFRAQLERVVRPTLNELVAIVNDIPDDYRDQVATLMKKMDPNRPGLYLADQRPQLTELRLYQGSGNDPNRPDNCRVGHFYLTTKQNVGEKFVGTVLALWQGRTMWPGADDARNAPLCTSMDREVGSKYGTCATCPQRPWRDGEKTNCNDDVVAFMLPKDMDDIILVRFSRTSESSGRQLAKFAAKNLVPWQQFYQITASERQGSGGSKIKWHVMKVEPLEETVPTALMELCAALCAMAEHDFILPGLGRIYNDAADVEGDGPATSGGGDGDDDDTKDYDDFEDNV